MDKGIEELLNEMKVAAEKATGGQWVRESGEGWDAICSDDDQLNEGFIIAEFQGPDAQANRLFTQAANPANTLTLIAALEQAQKRVDELEARGDELLRQARSFREAHDSASEIISRMERNKPVATLPTTRLWAGKVACFEEGDVITMLRVAGVNISDGKLSISGHEARPLCVKLPPRKTADRYADDVYTKEDVAAIYNLCLTECELRIKNAVGTVEGSE